MNSHPADRLAETMKHKASQLMWAMYNYGREGNTASAQCAVQAMLIELSEQQATDPCSVCNALIVPRNATHHDAADLTAAQTRGKLLAASLNVEQQAAPEAEEQQWSVSGDGRVLIANSFQHDVKLTLDGDFETAKQRIAYADGIARRLATPQSPPSQVPATWDREASIELIAAERITLILKPEADRTPADIERLAALNADMNALSPRVTQGMVDQLQEIAARLAQVPAAQSGGEATVDELIDLSAALEQRRILEEIKAVAAIFPLDDMPTPFQSAWRTCCEELWVRTTNGHSHFAEESVTSPLFAPATPALQQEPTVAQGVADWWQPLPEDPEERRSFDHFVNGLHKGDPRRSIAQALYIWGRAQRGGSYEQQCYVMANEVAKLTLATHPQVIDKVDAEGGLREALERLLLHTAVIELDAGGHSAILKARAAIAATGEATRNGD